MSKLISANILVNAALFQIVWLCCVIGSSYGLTWPAVLSFLALAVWQLAPARRADSDVKLLAAALLLGIIVDSLWVQLGFLDFKTDRPFTGFAPLWILFLWLGFALTVNHSLSWLKLHPLLPAAMGLIGGPLSYYAGLRFGAVEYLVDHLLVSASLGIAWALTMIILVKLSDELNRDR
jgi:hypothetical protein